MLRSAIEAQDQSLVSYRSLSRDWHLQPCVRHASSTIFVYDIDNIRFNGINEEYSRKEKNMRAFQVSLIVCTRRVSVFKVQKAIGPMMAQLAEGT